MDSPFTLDDLDVLIDALTAWENKDFGGMIMGGLLSRVLDKSNPNLEREDEERAAKFERERKDRSERSILLKAKLISMKDAIRASAFSEGKR